MYVIIVIYKISNDFISLLGLGYILLVLIVKNDTVDSFFLFKINFYVRLSNLS